MTKLADLYMESSCGVSCADSYDNEGGVGVGIVGGMPSPPIVRRRVKLAPPPNKSEPGNLAAAAEVASSSSSSSSWSLSSSSSDVAALQPIPDDDDNKDLNKPVQAKEDSTAVDELNELKGILNSDICRLELNKEINDKLQRLDRDDDGFDDVNDGADDVTIAASSVHLEELLCRDKLPREDVINKTNDVTIGASSVHLEELVSQEILARLDELSTSEKAGQNRCKSLLQEELRDLKNTNGDVTSNGQSAVVALQEELSRDILARLDGLLEIQSLTNPSSKSRNVESVERKCSEVIGNSSDVTQVLVAGGEDGNKKNKGREGSSPLLLGEGLQLKEGLVEAEGESTNETSDEMVVAQDILDLSDLHIEREKKTRLQTNDFFLEQKHGQHNEEDKSAEDDIKDDDDDDDDVDGILDLPFEDVLDIQYQEEEEDGEDGNAPDPDAKKKKQQAKFAIKWGRIAEKATFAFKSHIVPEELKRLFDCNLEPKALPAAVTCPVLTSPEQTQEERVCGGELNERESVALDCLRRLLTDGLNRTNYRNFWAIGMMALMHEEEKQVASWKIESIPLQTHCSNGDAHLIRIPGVIDNSPDIRKGDKIDVKIRSVDCNANQQTTENENGSLTYKMEVVKVVNDQVYLEFQDRFHHNKLFNRDRKLVQVGLDFVCNDYIFSMVNQVLKELSDPVMTSLFPPSPSLRHPENNQRSRRLMDPVWTADQLVFFDKNIRSNPEQTQTVLSILNGSSRPHPYILFGPPGTGKTVTLVESIKQVWKNRADAKILVAAPSNTAADLLATKLLRDVPPEQIVRLNAASRDTAAAVVDEKLAEICRKSAKELRIPDEVRIVVATLITCGSRWLRPRGAKTHVFVDEAGQAMEPEVLIPIQRHLIRGQAGQVVLAGDPHQLGPVVQSKVAQKLGMERSLLQRLMTDFDVYKPQQQHHQNEGEGEEGCPFSSQQQQAEGGGGVSGSYDSRYVTKLVRNFRSHEKLLRVPSDKFYDGGLKACADPKVVDFFTRFEWLKNKRCPVMFHGITGEHSRDGQSPSLYNRIEIGQVTDYVRKLLDGGAGVKHSDIGVICPYRRQVRMIKEALRQMMPVQMADQILVGSTEQFQGQERMVMLISTVRSTLKQDGNRSSQLGFLVNPQRFNVSVTRAQSLLIVIGDPHLLAKDSCWGDYLEYAIAQKAYVGVSYESKYRKKNRKAAVSCRR